VVKGSRGGISGRTKKGGGKKSPKKGSQDKRGVSVQKKGDRMRRLLHPREKGKAKQKNMGNQRCKHGKSQKRSLRKGRAKKLPTGLGSNPLENNRFQK